MGSQLCEESDLITYHVTKHNGLMSLFYERKSNTECLYIVQQLLKKYFSKSFATNWDVKKLLSHAILKNN